MSSENDAAFEAVFRALRSSSPEAVGCYASHVWHGRPISEIAAQLRKRPEQVSALVDLVKARITRELTRGDHL